MGIKEKPVFINKKVAMENLQKGEASCFDCGKVIKANGEEMENGSLFAYEDGPKEIFVFKCDDCFAKSPDLSEYKECEVYSRIVGYLRPVKQWNEGKRQEYTERKEYKTPQS